jgi:hypothetical protein
MLWCMVSKPLTRFLVGLSLFVSVPLTRRIRLLQLMTVHCRQDRVADFTLQTAHGLIGKTGLIGLDSQPASRSKKAEWANTVTQVGFPGSRLRHE